MRRLFLALWFGASIGWVVAASIILSPGDVAGNPTAHSRNALGGLMSDLDCTGFGRQEEADACRAIARQARQRELLLRREEAVDFGIYLVVVALPIVGTLIVGLGVTGMIDRSRRRARAERMASTRRRPAPLRDPRR